MTVKRRVSKTKTLRRSKAGSNGLTKDSFALCHQLRSVSVERLGRMLGRLNALDLEKVKAVVKGMMRL